MIYQVPNIKLPFDHTEAALTIEVAAKLRVQSKEIEILKIKRKSIDARRKPQVFFVYTLIVDVKTTIQEKILKKSGATVFKDRHYDGPVLESSIADDDRPVIIGAGPAGLFCGLVLAEAGAKPIIFERGEDAHTRKKAIEDFYESGQLDVHSNVTFGEGGAGTFSDGKLNSGVKDKFLRKEYILRTLVEHGADPSVEYMAKPHVGTDYLVDIVANMRKKIIALGGEVHFNSLVDEIQTQPSGIVLSVFDTKTEVKREYQASQVVLAMGHSARDTFNMMANKGFDMEAKPFAIGVRAEHPQVWINRSQYGDSHYDDKRLPSAEYKLTHQTDKGRGVYSFCMCPGGQVVNASSSEGECVCNGMSLFARDDKNANAAIIVTVKPEDFPDAGPLAGVHFQQKWERLVFDGTGDYRLVTQDYEAFYESVTGHGFPEKHFLRESFYQCDDVETTCRSGLVEDDIKLYLPSFVSEAIVDGMEAFGRKIKGFDHPRTRLIGVETRTSSPVRIIRNDGFQSNVRGVYPCGEGAGYAGGIMSAAIDGIKVAEQVIKDIKIRAVFE